MNKNSILAFLLIAITVVFFNSDMWNSFWYGTVLKKPVPTYVRPAPKSAPAGDETAVKNTPPAGPAISEAAELSQSVENEKDESDTVSTEAAAVEKVIEIETNRFIATVSTKGGRIISLRMKDFHYAKGDKKGEMIDLLPSDSEGGAQLSINNESFDEKFFNTDSAISETPVIVKDEPFELVLETKSSRGKPVQKVFTFQNDTYKIGYTVCGDGLTDQKVTLGWKGGIEESESAGGDAVMFDRNDRRRAHFSNGKTAQHIEMSKKGVEEPSGSYRWIGMSSKYFFISVVADKIYDADLRIEGKNVSKNPNDKNAEINYAISFQKQAESNEVKASIYAGPSKIGELSQHGLGFEKTMFPVISWARHILWADLWFPPIAEIILKVLLFFYNIVRDYGVAIFLLTLLTKVITYPMTASSMKSMSKMKDIQPKLVAIKQKYKSNPQKMNAEIMALYKAEGINPLNPGCLPMFLQMPIFIALFVVLRKAVELRGASSVLFPWISDLSHPEALFTLPFSIPLYGSNVALLPIIMALLTFYQQKMTITDPNQKMMVYMMPILMLVMFNGFPAGVVFYWTLSSAFGLLQQLWMNKKNAVSPAVAAVGGTPVKKPMPARKTASKR